MMVLGRGLIFQPVLLACTYNNGTIITLQKKNYTHNKLTVQASIIDMALNLITLNATK